MAQSFFSIKLSLDEAALAQQVRLVTEAIAAAFAVPIPLIIGVDLGGDDLCVSVAWPAAVTPAAPKPAIHRLLTSPRSFALRQLRKRVVSRAG